MNKDEPVSKVQRPLGACSSHPWTQAAWIRLPPSVSTDQGRTRTWQFHGCCLSQQGVRGACKGASLVKRMEESGCLDWIPKMAEEYLGEFIQVRGPPVTLVLWSPILLGGIHRHPSNGPIVELAAGRLTRCAQAPGNFPAIHTERPGLVKQVSPP